MLSWARSKLEGKIAQKREDVEYERSRGTPEGLADELETLAELEQDLRAATPQPEGEAIVVEDGPDMEVERFMAMSDAEVAQVHRAAGLDPVEVARDGAKFARLIGYADEQRREIDRLKKDVNYYEREIAKLREIVDHLDCIDRDADEAGIHRDFVERWRRGGE